MIRFKSLFNLSKFWFTRVLLMSHLLVNTSYLPDGKFAIILKEISSAPPACVK